MDEILLVDNCPYCDIFNKKKDINTKLYFPVKSQISRNTEFVILNCPYCNKPIVIFRDHVTSISREQWGRILYRVRQIFGRGIRLKIGGRYCNDHWYAHISHINTTKLKAAKDLRRY